MDHTRRNRGSHQDCQDFFFFFPFDKTFMPLFGLSLQSPEICGVLIKLISQIPSQHVRFRTDLDLVFRISQHLLLL